jgi:WD40 repeat protein
MEFSPDGDHFAALLELGQESIVAIHDSSDGKRSRRYVLPNRSWHLDWHPGGHGIAVPDFSGAVHWIDTETGATQVLGRHKAAAMFTVFTPDGRYLFSGGWDRELICWDVNAMRRVFTAGLESYHAQFHADGHRAAILVWPEMRLQFHSVERPVVTRDFAIDLGGGRNYAAFSPDGRWLAACGEERLMVWDLTSEGPGAVEDAAGNTRVAFTANGELVASREETLPNQTGVCFRWRLNAGTNGAAPVLQRLPMFVPTNFVSLSVVSNGVIWTTKNSSGFASLDRALQDENTWETTVDGLNGVSPDGRWLAMFRSFTPKLRVYRLPGFEPVATLTNEARISRFGFSPRGDAVVVSSRGGVEFWSTTTWQRTSHLTNFTGHLYSPDGRTIWLYTKFRAACLYDARTLEPLLPLPSGTIPLAFSSDGRLLATSVDARRVQVWDLAEVRNQLRAIGLDWSEDRAAGTQTGRLAEHR